MTDKTPAPTPEAEEPAPADRDLRPADLDVTRRLAAFTGGSDPWGEVLLQRLAAAVPGSTGRADADDATFLATMAALGKIEPKDPIEAMLAGQMIACHATALDLLRRAWIPEQHFEARARLLSLADKSARTMAVLAESLSRVRSGGKQTVVVRHQHVHVGDGGQALVAGEVTAGRREGERGGDGRQ